jgi:DNA replication protein DnaC
MKQLIEKLDQLKLTTMSQQLEAVVDEAEKHSLALSEMLLRLAEMELEARRIRSVERRLRQSRLQDRFSLDSFDFNHHPSRKKIRSRLLRLMDLDFIDEGTNVVIIGNPGVGKTFLAKIIGYRACQANYRVLFTPAMEMLNNLLASQVDHSLVRKLKTYTRPTLLLVDELGYLSLDQQTSNLFYQIISTRYAERRSTIITTNTTFSDWGNILHDSIIATAVADRLVENSEIFLLEGQSLRKAKKTRSQSQS